MSLSLSKIAINAHDYKSNCRRPSANAIISHAFAISELVMRKRPLGVTLAITKGKMPQMLAEKDSSTKTPRDKRNLYLAKEGAILPGSEAAVGLSKGDLQKRQKAEAEKKAKLKMPHYIVSKTRCDRINFLLYGRLLIRAI